MQLGVPIVRWHLQLYAGTVQLGATIAVQLVNTIKLVARESKTKLILFISRIHPVLPDIRFNQNTLERASHIKYLGIVLDDKLYSNNILLMDLVD